MNKHIILSPRGFEEWIEKNYPEMFSDWELKASEWIDLDEYIEKTEYQIMDAWRYHLRTGLHPDETPPED